MSPRPSQTARRFATELAIADRLHSAAIHLLRRLRKRDVASGLSAPRLSALSVVVFGGPLTLGELAAAEQVRPPTMTRIVRALEAKGLVARGTDANDRRVVRLRATPLGVRTMQKGRARRVELLSRWLEEMPRDELAVLEQGVAILERLLEEVRGGENGKRKVDRVSDEHR
jgi:DNA-binding MarR family transcriptional regulator